MIDNVKMIERDHSKNAFTLIEMLFSITILLIIMTVLGSMTGVIQKVWKEGKDRTEIFQSARTSLELLTRELTPVVVDTRMQFVIAPSKILSQLGAQKVAPGSPAMLWMSPLGQKGELRAVGYYLYRDTERKFYRLKRIYIAPHDHDGKESKFFPRMINESNPGDLRLRVSPVNADWFTRNWNVKAFDEEDPANGDAIVSSAADGVIAFWIQAYDLQGNPIPWLSESKVHPQNELIFNSAGLFHFSTTRPDEEGNTTIYLSDHQQALKANRVPSAIEVVVITLDQTTLERGLIPPEQTAHAIFHANGSLNLEASVASYFSALETLGIKTARRFSTRARLNHGN